MLNRDSSAKYMCKQHLFPEFKHIFQQLIMFYSGDDRNEYIFDEKSLSCTLINHYSVKASGKPVQLSREMLQWPLRLYTTNYILLIIWIFLFKIYI